MIAVPLAHVGGLPLEEGLLALAPAASALAVVMAAPLRRLGRCLRRPPRKRTERSPGDALK
jgi:hypothetical protein